MLSKNKMNVTDNLFYFIRYTKMNNGSANKRAAIKCFEKCKNISSINCKTGVTVNLSIHRKLEYLRLKTLLEEPH